MDGHVAFNKCSFDAAGTARLFSLDGNDNVCFGDQIARLAVKGCRIECTIDAHHYLPDGDAPWIWVYVSVESHTDGHDLDASSPLTELVRANMPLPMFFGVKGFED